MKKRRAAGYSINLLMTLYLALGVGVIVCDSLAFGLLYLALIALGFLAVAYSWCAKCPCRSGGCAHLWLGKLGGLLPAREPGRFTAGDWIGTAVYLGGLHLLPQVWLWQYKALFVLFWGLVLITFLVGTLFACPACENRACPLKVGNRIRV